MNTTTSASFCRTRPSTRFLLALIALLTLMSGCAVPMSQLGAPLAATTEPALHTSALTVHASEQTPDFVLPAAEDAEAWLDDLAPAKAKTAEETGAAAKSTEAPPAKRACPSEGERVLLIGDSLSAGLGPHMAKRARACGTTFFVHGVVGSHVTQWTQPSWLKAQLHRAKPTVVMVSLGGNDFVRNDPQNVQRAIDGFVKTVRASGARLLWISPPSMPFPDEVGARDMWQTAIDGDVNVDWYPTEELVIERVSDEVHPTIPEYDELSQTLWQWMSTVTE